MKIIRHQIPYVYGDTILLKPIADVHIGNKLCDLSAFKKYLASDEKALFIGLGDLLDSIIVQDKRYNKNADNTTTEAVIDEQIAEAYETLYPYKDRIIGLGEGNHERVIANLVTNPIARLCEKLECEYLGYSWMCTLSLREQDGRGRSVIIYANHGWGGGTRTEGGDLTKFSKVMTAYEADIYLFGHTHGLQAKRSPRLSLVGNKLIAKDRYLCICGTFLKTISPDSIPSWAETRGFHPARIGGITIQIKPGKDWVELSVNA